MRTMTNFISSYFKFHLKYCKLYRIFTFLEFNFSAYLLYFMINQNQYSLKISQSLTNLNILRFISLKIY